MLQRAASNAYSWWWASHIRTKQSKWLEQNLQDIEEKTNYTLKIINQDGDTFAQRAEMYYKKRPEIVNFIEEAFRSYRALAERYDHLSNDLQSANRTIATAFPEQIPFPLDEEDDELDDKALEKELKDNKEMPQGNVPRVPEMPKKDFRSPSMMLSRKGTHGRNLNSVTKGVLPTSSGLSRHDAITDIDRLQKGILALQTEKEFVKSMYEGGYEKFCAIEDEIDEMQKKVNNLQDEFGIGNSIDDTEARSLMACTTIKSCKETLGKIQEKLNKSEAEVNLEKGRVKEALQKFETLKKDFFSDKKYHSKKPESSRNSRDWDVESLSENFNKELQSDSGANITVVEMADKIDELVENVVCLETGTSSQTALVDILRSETDKLQVLIGSLEEDKETLVSSSESINERIRAMEEEFCSIKSLCHRFEEQNKNIRTDYEEATCNADHLSEKIHRVTMDEAVQKVCVKSDKSTEEEYLPDDSAIIDPAAENAEEMKREYASEPTQGKIYEKKDLSEAARSCFDAEPQRSETEDDANRHENIHIVTMDEAVQKVGVKSGKSTEEEYLHDDSAVIDLTAENVDERKREDAAEPTQGKIYEKKDSSEGASSCLDAEPQRSETEDDANKHERGRKLSIGSEEREKDLLDECTLVLQNYKDIKRKLSNVEKKNRDGFFELVLELRELKNAVTNRDVEIQSLRDKLEPAEKDEERIQTEDIDLNQEGDRESISQSASYPVSSFPTPSSQMQRGAEKLPVKANENELKPKQEAIDKISWVEQSIRKDIDDLLEENLEVWLRFSTSVHQIQKYQKAVEDLKYELLKLNENKKQAGDIVKHQSHSSNAKPVYRQLREIRTELQLWLENNALLKDEVLSRYSFLCSMQDEISQATQAETKEEKTKLCEYQAAKFHSEVLNMKQENTKVLNELETGIHTVVMLKVEVERNLAYLEEDMRISASKNIQPQQSRMPTTKPRIPLRSFLFGVKLRKQKQSIFSPAPPIKKQYSYITPTEGL